jgi:Domain of unknown function (DUF4360)
MEISLFYEHNQTCSLLTLSISITVPFPSFSLRRGDNIPQSEASGNCEFSILIDGKPGRKVTVDSTTYHDDLDLGAGETATHYMTYFFQSHGQIIKYQIQAGC